MLLTIKKYFVACALLLGLTILINACHKKYDNSCTTCNCEHTITTFNSIANVSDSATAMATVQGTWQLKCSSRKSKYGDGSYTDHTNTDKLSVVFTDTNYTYFRNDTLLFVYPYFTDTNGILHSPGGSFYFGTLDASGVKLLNGELGIGVVIPYTGSCYLVFKKP